MELEHTENSRRNNELGDKRCWKGAGLTKRRWKHKGQYQWWETGGRSILLLLFWFVKFLLLLVLRNLSSLPNGVPIKATVDHSSTNSTITLRVVQSVMVGLHLSTIWKHFGTILKLAYRGCFPSAVQGGPVNGARSFAWCG